MEASSEELRALQRLALANGWAAMPGAQNYQPALGSHDSRVAATELKEATLASMVDTPSLQLGQYW